MKTLYYEDCMLPTLLPFAWYLLPITYYGVPAYCFDCSCFIMPADHKHLQTTGSKPGWKVDRPLRESRKAGRCLLQRQLAVVAHAA